MFKPADEVLNVQSFTAVDDSMANMAAITRDCKKA
jgi:hypothetical protein